MISVEEAQEIIHRHVPSFSPIHVPLHGCLGLTLAQDIIATEDTPLFNNSAVDGYAVRTKDLHQATQESPVHLKNIGSLPAGASVSIALKSGECSHIATGAKVPSSADAVVMKEAVIVEDNHISFTRVPQVGENIRYQGEDMKKGDLILSKGTQIQPAGVAILAFFGYTQVLVIPQIKVAILATGSELVEVHEVVSGSQIRDSNSSMLAALLQNLPCFVHRIGIVRDDPRILKEKIQTALHSDLILISGGISVGEHDYVKAVLAELGVEELFWKVNIKPGKPMFVGKLDQKLIFGLPGNPASSFVNFEIFVRPLLKKMLGFSHWEIPQFQAQLEAKVTHQAGRTQYLRATIRKQKNQYLVTPLLLQGSHSLSSLAQANAFIEVPPNTPQQEVGEMVTVIPLTTSSHSIEFLIKE